MVASSVLDNGLRWQVGTGNKIRIWQDRWLPTPPSFKVVTPCSVMSKMATVDNHIDPITRSWHVSMIDHVFLPHEAEVIKSIPLSNRIQYSNGPLDSIDRLLIGVKSISHIEFKVKI